VKDEEGSLDKRLDFDRRADDLKIARRCTVHTCLNMRRKNRKDQAGRVPW
jgi:hypothetical protein